MTNPQSKIPNPKSPIQNGQSILIAEDSPTQAALIRLLLEHEGYTVRVAGDGLRALEAIAGGRPDVVLADLHMPNMDGLQLVEALGSRYPALPVVLLTSISVNGELALEALSKGAVSYVPKSEVQRDLLGTVQTVLAVVAAQPDPQQPVADALDTMAGLVLAGDRALLLPLLGRCKQDLVHDGYCDLTGTMRVAMALYEAWSWGLSGGKAVQFSRQVSPTETAFVVQPERTGPGRWLAPPERPDLEQLDLRGPLLMTLFMDELRYNDAAGQLTLIKRKSASAP